MGEIGGGEGWILNLKRGVVEPRLGRGRFAFTSNAVRRLPKLGSPPLLPITDFARCPHRDYPERGAEGGGSWLRGVGKMRGKGEILGAERGKWG